MRVKADHIRMLSQMLLMIFLNFTFVGSIVISAFLPILRVPKIFPGMPGKGVPLCILGSTERCLTLFWEILFLLAFIALLLMVCAIIGRALCGWGCPIGFFQDLVIRLKVRLRIPSFEPNEEVHLRLTGLKFAILFLFIILAAGIGASFAASSIAGVRFREDLPGMVRSSPVCTYCITPVVRQIYDLFYFQRFNLSDPLFYMQVSVFVIFIVGVAITPRFWCRYLCPVGALSALFNKMSFLKIEKVEPCTGCNICIDVCPTRVSRLRSPIRPGWVSDSSCIFCLNCIDVCPKACLELKFGNKTLYRKEVVRDGG